MRKLLLVTMFAALCASLAYAGMTEYNLYVPAPRIENISGGVRVILDDCINTGEIGDPRLPVWGLNLIVPPGEEAARVLIEKGTGISLGSGYYIPPVQKQYPISFQGAAVPDAPNAAVYEKNALFPQELTAHFRTDFFRGYGIAAIAVNPVQYNPVTGELVYYPNLKVKVETVPTAKAESIRSTMLKRDARTWTSLDRQTDNSQDAVLYGAPDNGTDEPYYDILLITHQNMVDLWDDYVDWKTKSGYYIAIETTQDIYAAYPGQDNQEKIRNCIIDYYENWDLTYVFLAADDEFIPHRGLYNASGYTDNDIAGDVYYAGLDGNWNTDGDTHWGEANEADLRMEVYVSRAPVDSQTEIVNFTNKQLMVQREPVIDEVETGLMVGEDLGWPIWAWEYKEEVRTGSSSWGMQTAPFPADWEVRTLYETPGQYWSGPNDLIPLLNQGPLYVNHLGHADVTYMMQLYNNNLTSTTVTNNGVNHNFYLVYSQGCYCGSFDNRTTGSSYTEDCISEQFTTQLATGAYAVISNSRYGWGDLNTTQGSSQYYDKQFFDAIWGEGITNIAETNADSKHDCIPFIDYNQNRWCYYELNVFAEPSLDLWTNEPGNLSVTYPAAVMLGSTSMQVTVTGVANARVCLSQNGTIFGVGFTNASGVCTIVFEEPLLTLGEADLVVTAHDYLPFEGVTTIIPPTGPYVIFNNAVVDDQGGNANGNWDYAETVYLDMTVENVGVENASNVTASITSADSLVTILQGTANFGNINQGTTAFVNNAYRVSVNGAVEDGHSIQFTMNAVSGTSTWTSYFSLTVHAPDIKFGEMIVNDAQGNNNGNLDPGESAILNITLLNDGGCFTTGLDAALSTNDTYITIGTPTAAYGLINAGGEAMQSYNVTVSSACPQEHVVEFSLNFADDLGYTGGDGFNTTVGDITYDPTGPDAYGYYAYDPNDAPELPEYNWVEISADSGGLGTRIQFTADDQVLHFALPFDFQYYGFDYDSVTVSSNGYLAMGVVTSDDYSNSAIPNSDGPAAMIAMYWEDLSPQRTNSGGVWQYFDAANHKYIVEYNHVEQYSPVGSFETFQVILFDPEYYPTSTGDGRILMNYKSMSTISCTDEGTYGIENPAETTGIQYLFDGALDTHAMPIGNEMCVLYSTTLGTPSLVVTLTPSVTPIVIPPTGGNFGFNGAVANNGGQAVTFDLWTKVTLPNGSQYGPILLRQGITLGSGGSLSRNLNQTVPGSAPAGAYTYHMYTGNYAASIVIAEDDFPFTKSGVDASGAYTSWDITGWDDGQTTAVLPSEFHLKQNYPNPYNPVTTIEYTLPEAVKVNLSVYNNIGQLVATLVDGMESAGYKSVEFDGAQLSSGVYFYKLEAGEFSDMKKMVLIK